MDHARAGACLRHVAVASQRAEDGYSRVARSAASCRAPRSIWLCLFEIMPPIVANGVTAEQPIQALTQINLK